ncbi:MAG: Flp pilus assembly protein CpaB [Pseudomonadota bacterium]
MNPRSLVLILIAVVIAGAAAYVARSLMQEQPAQAEIVEVRRDTTTTGILVAAADLPIGTIVEQDHFRWQPWPEDALDERYMLEGSVDLTEGVYGRVIRASLLEGEPVTGGKLVGPGERGFLAAVLSPGHRAITVPITQTSGLAGFIFPGDRVDMILTHQIEDARQQSQQVSETVLYNLRVLAIDQRTNNQENQPLPGSTVTFEVNPKIAEMVALVMQMGDLSLSLRSLSDQAQGDDQEAAVNPEFLATTGSYTSGADVSALLPDLNARANGGFVSVARGSNRDSVDIGGLQ